MASGGQRGPAAAEEAHAGPALRPSPAPPSGAGPRLFALLRSCFSYSLPLPPFRLFLLSCALLSHHSHFLFVASAPSDSLVLSSFPVSLLSCFLRSPSPMPSFFLSLIFPLPSLSHSLSCFPLLSPPSPSPFPFPSPSPSHFSFPLSPLIFHFPVPFLLSLPLPFSLHLHHPFTSSLLKTTQV